MKRFSLLIGSMVISLAIAGCSKKEEAPAPDAKKEEVKKADPAPEAKKPAPPADPVAEAKNIFNTRCVVCHGASGKGDGATAATLNPKPRDYTDAAWQKTVTDEQLAKSIVEGGAATGKSPLMPANPDLKGKDAVVAEMVKLIRGFAGAAEPEAAKPDESK